MMTPPVAPTPSRRSRIGRLAGLPALGARRWQVAAALVVWLVGSTLALVGFRVVSQRDDAEHQRLMAERILLLETRMRQQFELPVEVLRSLASFFSASDEVTREEFTRFVASPLKRFPAVSMLEWAPWVPGSERERFEASADLADFRITELGTDNRFQRAGSRREYAPLYFLEPSTDLSALGFDLLSEDARRRLVRLAISEGTPLASARFNLVEDPPEVWSISVYMPVYHPGVLDSPLARLQAVRGLAIAIFRLPTLAERVLAEAPDVGLGFQLVDGSDGPEQVLLAHRFPAELSPWQRASLVESPWPYPGRDWALHWVPLQPRPVSTGAWVVMLSGLFISLLAGLSVAGSVLVVRLRRQVEQAEQLGQYRLEEKLGQGGMGVVYRARHAFLRRPTAIKLLSASEGDVAIARFEREVQLTARLTHPNTIAIYDYGRTADGDFFYAMELLHGLSFEQLVRSEGALPQERVVFLIRQVLEALAEAHGVGLIHRDIKPANLMLTRRGRLADFVKVLDFGLVKETSSGDESLTQQRIVMGTPLYLSPEAIEGGERLDGRADLYAVGLVAWFLLTGQPTFTGPGVVQVCYQHCHQPPDPPSRHCLQAIDEGLEAIVMRALAKRREDRFESADAFLSALEALDLPRTWTTERAQAWWARWEASHPRPSEVSASHPTMKTVV
jgi:serine/threonine-protein kinase